MKNLLGASAAALSALALGSTAHAAGVVDLSYVGVEPDNSDNLNGVHVGGAATAKLATNWTAQFDADFSRLDVGGGDATISSGAAHATYHGADWNLGAYANVASFFGSGVYGIGAEGQYFIDRFALGGQIGYDSVDNSGGSDFWDGDVSAKYFFTDNISAGAHYGRVDLDGSDDFNIYGVSAEWKADSSPIGLFASYNRLDMSNSGSDANEWQLGVRWAFGGDTLIQREKEGPSLLRGNVLARYLID